MRYALRVRSTSVRVKRNFHCLGGCVKAVPLSAWHPRSKAYVQVPLITGSVHEELDAEHSPAFTAVCLSFRLPTQAAVPFCISTAWP